MSIFFTADTHFSHKNILKYEPRPYSSVEEMDEGLIENWNKKVTNKDQIYILGDFFFGKGKGANELLKRLNGKKFLIRGNHDSFLRDKEFDENLFGWIKDYHVLRYNKQKYVLFHFPIATWDCKHYGAVHLYGHIHSSPSPTVRGLTNAFNVGVDVNNFEPVSLEEIQEMENRNFCIECNKMLDIYNNEYHERWNACNHVCYGRTVGEYSPSVK